MMVRFTRIGIGPGVPCDPARLDPKLRTAIKEGVASAAKQLKAKALTQTSSQGLFGTREELGSDDLTFRSMGAMLGIDGNSSEEAFFCQPTDGTRWQGAGWSQMLGDAFSAGPAATGNGVLGGNDVQVAGTPACEESPELLFN